jgi:hypothetical protein
MLILNLKKDERWVRSFCKNYKQQYTQSGRVWEDMKLRCTLDSSQQRKFPKYIGCTMSKNFEDFQFFVEWHMAQIGFGLPGYHIDKDMLVPGNKLYSENTCVLIPAALNTFAVYHDASRGLYPVGVSLHGSGKFSATVAINGKSKHLGLFTTPEKAFERYKTIKEKLAKEWYERLLNKEFAVDARVIDAMKNWTLRAV